MRRQTPHPNRMGHRPRVSAIMRFGLERLAAVRPVVVADLNHDVSVTGLDPVQFVVVLHSIAPPDRNIGEPAPVLTVVRRFGYANLPSGFPKLLSGVEQAA